MFRKTGITLLMIWAAAVTVLRAARWPNDFAEVHWLLDYRFGFVRRGLIGTIVSIATTIMQTPVTARLISIVAGVIFLSFCAVLIGLSLRVVRRSGWSTDSVLTALVFLSSPFVVMSAHLIGYYDNIVIILAILSIALLLRGEAWLAAGLQAVAICVHESSLVIGLPLFYFAWVLINCKRERTSERSLPVVPLLLPIFAALAIALSQERVTTQHFRELLTAHLSQFDFIQENRNKLLPEWLSTPFRDSFVEQRSSFIDRLFSLPMQGLVLPSVLMILYSTASAYKVRRISLELFGLLGACFAPQIMHVIAWDTARIWTLSILSSFIALWIYSELVVTRRESPLLAVLSVLVIGCNVIVLTPLMDNQTDHLRLRMRLLLFAPVILAGISLVLGSVNPVTKKRLCVEGHRILEMLKPARHPGGIKRQTRRT